ncbi:MAG: hypothetical protein O6922_09005 [Chloroflexi bacterium]|nr:hypothetical protein [Chloroflexota bacterium]
MDNSAVLSQDAIDALLNSEPEEAADAPEPEDSDPGEEPVNIVEAPPLHPEASEEVAEAAPAAPPAAPAAPAIPHAPVYQPLPPPPPLVPPPVVAQPGKGGITREEAVEIAGEAAETEGAPIQAKVSRVSKRVDTLEAAVDQIAELEEEISRLKKRPEPKPDPRILKLYDRVLALEKRARKSPVFGLYDKFTCSSCGHIGEAQVRVRCGHCATDGWYGKKAKKESQVAPEKNEPDGGNGAVAEETPAQAEITDNILMGLDPNLGI